MSTVVAIGGASIASRMIVWNDPLLPLVEGTCKAIECALSVFKLFDFQKTHSHLVAFGQRYFIPISDWSVFLYVAKRVNDWTSKDEKKKYIWQREFFDRYFMYFLTAGSVCSLVGFLDKYKVVLIDCGKIVSRFGEIFFASAFVCDLANRIKFLRSYDAKKYDEKLKRWRDPVYAGQDLHARLQKLEQNQKHETAEQRTERLHLNGIFLSKSEKVDREKYQADKIKKFEKKIANHKLAYKQAWLSIAYDVCFIASSILSFCQPYYIGTRIALDLLRVSSVVSALELICFLVDKVFTHHVPRTHMIKS